MNIELLLIIYIWGVIVTSVAQVFELGWKVALYDRWFEAGLISMFWPICVPAMCVAKVVER